MKKCFPLLWVVLFFLTGVRPVQGTHLPAGVDIAVPILAYHNIGPQALSKWTVSAEQLERQMDVLQAYGYQTVGLQDYLDYSTGAAAPPSKPIIITFDDGYQGVYTYALPILQRRGMTASIFIPTGKIGENVAGRVDNSWLGDEPLSYHLIWPEVAELAVAGFEIGSHTRSHPVLTDIDDEEAQNEIHQSRLDLQTYLLGYPVDFFAYPHGVGADDLTILGYVQTDYRAAVGYLDDQVANPADPDLSLWELPRRAVYRDVSLDLDPSNPWPFFMRRVKPDFPIPNIIPTNWDSRYDPDPWQVLDADGLPQAQFYPGKTVTIKASVKCGDSSVPVIASLVLHYGESVIYDSHLDGGDVELDPLDCSRWQVTTFTYSWTPPQEVPLGEYIATLSVRDQTYLLGYYQSAPQALFSVTFLPLVRR